MFEDHRGRGKASKFYQKKDFNCVSVQSGSLPTADRSAYSKYILKDEDLPRETLCPGPRAESVRAMSTLSTRRSGVGIAVPAVFMVSVFVVSSLWFENHPS